MSTPERIWAKANYGKNNAGYWRDEPIIPNKPEKTGTEYVRADLCAKSEAISLTQDDRVRALIDALREFIYETTHLSPIEDDGSHWCKISADCLEKGRAALRDMGEEDD